MTPAASFVLPFSWICLPIIRRLLLLLHTSHPPSFSSSTSKTSPLPPHPLCRLLFRLLLVQRLFFSSSFRLKNAELITLIDLCLNVCFFTGMTDIDYSKYPSVDMQRSWLKAYLTAFKRLSSNHHANLDGISVADAEVEELLREVELFTLVSGRFLFLWRRKLPPPTGFKPISVNVVNSIIFDLTSIVNAQINYVKKEQNVLHLSSAETRSQEILFFADRSLPLSHLDYSNKHTCSVSNVCSMNLFFKRKTAVFIF